MARRRDDGHGPVRRAVSAGVFDATGCFRYPSPPFPCGNQEGSGPVAAFAKLTRRPCLWPRGWGPDTCSGSASPTELAARGVRFGEEPGDKLEGHPEVKGESFAAPSGSEGGGPTEGRQRNGEEVASGKASRNKDFHKGSWVRARQARSEASQGEGRDRSTRPCEGSRAERQPDSTPAAAFGWSPARSVRKGCRASQGDRLSQGARAKPE